MKPTLFFSSRPALISLLCGAGLFLSSCISTDKSGKVGEAIDTGVSVLNTVKKIITFPIDIFTPSAPITEQVKEDVPGGLPTWIGSTLGGLVAGFLAGRLRKKPDAPPEVKS